MNAGDFGRSKKGHDKGRLYVVTGISKNGEVLLCDGSIRPLAKPKKKNIIHVQPVIHIDEKYKEMCLQNGRFHDEGIKRAIRIYEKSIKEGD